jgi:hypothetical protein
MKSSFLPSLALTLLVGFSAFAQEVAAQRRGGEVDGVSATAPRQTDIGLLRSVIREADAIHLSFGAAVNPLTVRRGVQLARRDGPLVGFTMKTALDGTEVVLIPEDSAEPLTVILNGVEARNGKYSLTETRRP